MITIQEIAVIGLGKMGFPLAINMVSNGFKVTAFDVSETAIEAIKKEGISTESSLEALCRSFSSRKVIWLMIPAGKLVDEVIEQQFSQLTKRLEKKRIQIDKE